MKIFTYIKDNSSRVNRKNFQKIGDLPMWELFINNFSDFDVFIDTDSDEVLRNCENKSHVTAFKRDQRFIDMENDRDNKLSPVLLMTHDFLDKYVKDDNEIIVTTHVTSPFLEPKTVLEAADKLNEFEFVHSVKSIQDFAWLGNKFKPINFDQNVVQRTQDLEKIYFSNGAFFMFKKKTFKKYNNRIGPNTYYYPLNQIESIEIDTQEDLEFAKIVYNGVK